MTYSSLAWSTLGGALGIILYTVKGRKYENGCIVVSEISVLRMKLFNAVVHFHM